MGRGSALTGEERRRLAPFLRQAAPEQGVGGCAAADGVRRLGSGASTAGVAGAHGGAGGLWGVGAAHVADAAEAAARCTGTRGGRGRSWRRRPACRVVVLPKVHGQWTGASGLGAGGVPAGLRTAAHAGHHGAAHAGRLPARRRRARVRRRGAVVLPGGRGVHARGARHGRHAGLPMGGGLPGRGGDGAGRGGGGR